MDNETKKLLQFAINETIRMLERRANNELNQQIKDIYNKDITSLKAINLDDYTKKKPA